MHDIDALVDVCAGTAAPHRDAEQFSEQQSTEVRISGRSIVGAAIAATQAPALTPELYLSAGAASDSPICIESTTVDGSYKSSGQIDGPAANETRGVLRFRYGDNAHPSGETNYRVATDRFHADGLAVLAIVGACNGSGRRDRFVVVNRTGRSDYEAMAITVYVNTARSDADLSFVPKDGKLVRVHCLPLQTTFQRIAYDATCTLNGPFDTVTRAQLILSRYGEAEPPLEFSLMFAKPTARP